MNRRDYGSDEQQFGASGPRRDAARQAQGYRRVPRGGEQYGQYSGQSPGSQQGGYAYDQGPFAQPRRTFRSEEEPEFGTPSAEDEGRVGGIERNSDPRTRSWAGATADPTFVEDWRSGESDWRRADFRRQQHGVNEGNDYNRNDYNRSDWRGQWRDPSLDSGRYQPQRGGYSWEHDSPNEGSHHPTLRERIFGRGPKNYSRSDDRIREDIHERLHAHPYVDSREVTVDVKDGIVNLSGTVTGRQDKHDVENIVDAVFGVKDIHNNIRVARTQNADLSRP
jgi:hypothetical protein